MSNIVVYIFCIYLVPFATYLFNSFEFIDKWQSIQFVCFEPLLSFKMWLMWNTSPFKVLGMHYQEWCPVQRSTVYPKKYAHGFCFAVLCCGYTLTDFSISIRLTSLALGQSNDCPSASKATLMNMDKYFMWIHYERLHNHNKAKHNKPVCIFLGIYCMLL